MYHTIPYHIHTVPCVQYHIIPYNTISYHMTIQYHVPYTQYHVPYHSIMMHITICIISILHHIHTSYHTLYYTIPYHHTILHHIHPLFTVFTHYFRSSYPRFHPRHVLVTSDLSNTQQRQQPPRITRLTLIKIINQSQQRILSLIQSQQPIFLSQPIKYLYLLY